MADKKENALEDRGLSYQYGRIVILAGSRRELPGQLFGGLPGSLTPGIDALRNQALEHKGFPWLGLLNTPPWILSREST